LHCVVWWLDTSVSEDHTVFIHRVEVCDEWKVDTHRQGMRRGKAGCSVSQ